MTRATRYADYPHLFWDLDPGAPVDVRHPVVLARLLSRGSVAEVARFVTRDEVRQRLSTLPVADHTRLFWMRVVDAPAATPTGRD
jgi:hypothetical protein